MNWLLTTCAAPVMSPFFTDEKRPPLGVGFLISVLRRAGHQVHFIDNYLKPNEFLETGYLASHRIDAIGIYVNTVCLDDFHRMIARIEALRRSGAWRGLVVAGGPHPSVLPESMPDAVDHVVIGEGERAILNIAAGGAPRIIRCDPIKDLDSLPLPAWDDFLGLPYHWNSRFLETEPIVAINTSRGCPFSCSFCSVQSVWGRTYRAFSVDWIMENIHDLIGKFGARGFYFREDNFTVSRRRVLEFCERKLAEGLDFEWICETRVDSLDQEMIGQMARAGCKALYMGIESGSQRLLDFMNKGIQVDQTRRAFAFCREAGIKTYASLIVGVPAETEEDLELTDRLLEDIHPDYMSKNIFVGLPQSQLLDYAMSHGLHEFIDRRGLVYLKGHDARVDRYYGGQEIRKVPYPEREHYVISQEWLRQGRRWKAVREALSALGLAPQHPRYWLNLLKTLSPRFVLRTYADIGGFSFRGKIRRLMGRAAEEIEVAFTRTTVHHRFVIVSAQRNAGGYVSKCLDSVFRQDYDRGLVRHIVIDDASTDDTPERIRRWMEEHPGHQVELIANRERQWLCANNLRGFDLAGPGDILIELNGDDWLPDPGALRFLNKIYADPEVWMTYNSLRFHRNGVPAEIWAIDPVSKEVVENNEFRKAPWTFSHLHSLRCEFFHRLDRRHLVDPETGGPWTCSVDHAFYLPLLELAGKHARHLHRVTYAYNLNENSIQNRDPFRQKYRSRLIRSLPPERPLERLVDQCPKAGRETDAKK